MERADEPHPSILLYHAGFGWVGSKTDSNIGVGGWGRETAGDEAYGEETRGCMRIMIVIACVRK